MKTIVYISLSLVMCLCSLTSFAQDQKMSEILDLELSANKIYDPNISSSAWWGSLSFYPYNNEEAPLFGDEVTFNGGISGGYWWNGGKLDNGQYFETTKNFRAGVATALNFQNSMLKLDLSYGIVWSTYTLKSGFDRSLSSPFISTKVSYNNYDGRLNGDLLFPAYGITLIGSKSIYPQEFFSSGNNELQHRQGESSQHANGFSVDANLCLVDFGYSYIPSVDARFIAGGYKSNAGNITYVGYGAGLKLTFENTTAVYIDLINERGLENNRYNNLVLTAGIHYSLISLLLQ